MPGVGHMLLILALGKQRQLNFWVRDSQSYIVRLRLKKTLPHTWDSLSGWLRSASKQFPVRSMVPELCGMQFLMFQWLVCLAVFIACGTSSLSDFWGMNNCKRFLTWLISLPQFLSLPEHSTYFCIVSWSLQGPLWSTSSLLLLLTAGTVSSMASCISVCSILFSWGACFGLVSLKVCLLWNKALTCHPSSLRHCWFCHLTSIKLDTH